MTLQLTCLEVLLGMLDFSRLLRICRLICRFMSIEEYIEMEQESTKHRLWIPSIKERMAFLTITGEHWAGIQCQYRPTHLVALCSR